VLPIYVPARPGRPGGAAIRSPWSSGGDDPPPGGARTPAGSDGGEVPGHQPAAGEVDAVRDRLDDERLGVDPSAGPAGGGDDDHVPAAALDRLPPGPRCLVGQERQPEGGATRGVGADDLLGPPASVVLGGEHLRRPRVTANRLVAILAGEILDSRRAALAAGRLRVGQRRPGEGAVVSADGEDAGLAELVAVEAADLAGILALGAVDLPRDDEPHL